jgi:hypothetical protein
VFGSTTFVRVGNGWVRAWDGGELRRGVKDGILESLFFCFPVYPILVSEGGDGGMTSGTYVKLRTSSPSVTPHLVM